VGTEGIDAGDVCDDDDVHGGDDSHAPSNWNLLIPVGVVQPFFFFFYFFLTLQSSVGNQSVSRAACRERMFTHGPSSSSSSSSSSTSPVYICLLSCSTTNPGATRPRE